jgi:hypothetical protein
MKRCLQLIQILLLIAAGLHVAAAQDRTLTIQVNDAQGHPLSGVRISTHGRGFVSEATDVAGKTKILIESLAGAVTLELVSDTDNRDLVFMQPWDGRVTVPPFRNDSENFVLVVLIPLRLKLYIMSAGAPQNSFVASLSHRSAQPARKKDLK